MDFEYLLTLQGIRESFPHVLGPFFMLVSDLVNSAALVAIPCIIFWCFDKRRGMVTLFSFALGAFVTTLVKVIFCIPRPWMLDPRIEPFDDAIESATGYSFPSGHTQASASVLGSLGWEYRKETRWVLPLCGALVLLVALSRNFLGVHTPQDVLGGMVVGILSVIAAEKLLDWAESAPGRDAGLALAACVITAIGCLFVALKPYPELSEALEEFIDVREMALDCYQASGFFAGAFVSWWAERRWVRFDSRCALRQGLLRLVVGIALLLVFRYGLTAPLRALDVPELYDYVKGFLSVIGAVVVAPMAFTALEAKANGDPAPLRE